jgi:hypothetical protein
MPPPHIWGPPTWTFIHTLVEKINEDDFNKLFPQLFNKIKQICSFLPCPECSMHAKMNLGKIKTHEIKTKTDLINMMYLFHNMVNVMKKKGLYNYADMSKYKNINIAVAFNNFVNVYHTKGDMKQLSETFQRQLVINDLRKWLLHNMKSFS